MSTNGFRAFCQHTANPLHVLCRLISLGFSRATAAQLAHWYEVNLYRRSFLQTRKEA